MGKIEKSQSLIYTAESRNALKCQHLRVTAEDMLSLGPGTPSRRLEEARTNEMLA